MPATTNRAIHLAQRPTGWPDDSTFELVEGPVPEAGAGEVLVRNVYMSVDPYMRGRMNDVESYTPPFQVGQPLEGGAIGRVEASNSPDYAAGDYVQSGLGWREYFVSDGRGLGKLDPKAAPLTQYLGALGGTGFTAYVGLLDLGEPQEGQTVFVSGAAGATGSVVGQLAKLHGCRVVGSAGSDEKTGWLTGELGFDAAVNYKTEDLHDAVAAACPGGIDIYFDNVGGEHLEVALDLMNDFGRIVLCGGISLYNQTEPQPGPHNLMMAVRKRLTLRGFIVSDHAERRADFQRDMTRWLGEGDVIARETVVEGIENAPGAFLGLLRGENLGKMVVQLGPER